MHKIRWKWVVSGTLSKRTPFIYYLWESGSHSHYYMIVNKMISTSTTRNWNAGVTNYLSILNHHVCLIYFQYMHLHKQDAGDLLLRALPHSSWQYLLLPREQICTLERHGALKQQTSHMAHCSKAVALSQSVHHDDTQLVLQHAS